MLFPRLHALAIASAVGLFTWLTACDTTVTPLLESDRDAPYTIWGQFNAKTDTHAVRVFVIDDKLRLLRPDPIDAAVTSTDLDSGERRVWRDSLVRLEDGDFRHVFWDTFPTRAGQRFRLEARRSDGKSSWAETTIPPPVTLEVLEPNLNNVITARQRVRIAGEPPSIPRIDLVYRVVSAETDGLNQTSSRLVLPYRQFVQLVRGQWEVEIDFQRDFSVIFQTLDLEQKPTASINLFELRMSVHVGDEHWVSPIGDFDPDFLVEPGVFSNVQNGLGFVGAGYIETVVWRPPQELLDRAGFSG